MTMTGRACRGRAEVLTWFDTGLRDLDEVIKAKKRAPADVELVIEKLKHDLQSLAKE